MIENDSASIYYQTQTVTKEKFNIAESSISLAQSEQKLIKQRAVKSPGVESETKEMKDPH